MFAGIKSIAAAGFCAVIASSAAATTFSYTGTLDYDDSLGYTYFTVDSPSIVTLQTFSYAGGTQADGNVVAAGGFNPIISLFDPTDSLIAFNSFGTTPPVGVDPVTGYSFDASMELLLDAGAYVAVVTQYDNYATGPSFWDGFERFGDHWFTSMFACSNGAFCDVGGDNRTAEWAMDISIIAAVPLPASLPLLMLGLGGLAVLRRRKRT